MPIGRFYVGIGALIRRTDDGKYLLLQRAPDKDFGAGVWECVTGRVNQGESFEEALHREVREEVGMKVQIERIVGTIHFYRGSAQPENETLGIVYGCIVQPTERVHLSAEHSAFRWVTVSEAQALLTAEDPSTRWIRRVIQRAERMRNGDQVQDSFELN